MPEPIGPRAAARRIAIGAITNEIDDAMGIAELLGDAANFLSPQQFDEACAAVTRELEAIRDELRERWGVTDV